MVLGYHRESGGAEWKEIKKESDVKMDKNASESCVGYIQL